MHPSGLLLFGVKSARESFPLSHSKAQPASHRIASGVGEVASFNERPPPDMMSGDLSLSFPDELRAKFGVQHTIFRYMVRGREAI